MLPFLHQNESEPLNANPPAVQEEPGLWNPVGLMEWIEGLTGMGFEIQGKIVTSLLALLTVYLLRRLVMRVVDRRVDDPRLLYQ